MKMNCKMNLDLNREQNGEFNKSWVKFENESPSARDTSKQLVQNLNFHRKMRGDFQRLENFIREDYSLRRISLRRLGLKNLKKSFENFFKV